MMIGCCGRCGGPRRCPFRLVRGAAVKTVKSEIKKKNQNTKYKNPKLSNSNSLNRNLRSTNTQDLLSTAQHHHLCSRLDTKIFAKIEWEDTRYKQKPHL
jgi:hypothetical protein